MKTIFIHAKSLLDVKLTEEALKRLPKQSYGLITNIQHLHKLRELEKQIPNSILGGQILGCRADAAEKIKDKVDAFLFVGTGVFHPIQAALKTNKDVWLWDPREKKLNKLDANIIENFKKKKTVSYNNFLNAKTVGVLITTKIGQNDNKIGKYSEDLKMRKALELKKRTDKKYYLFAFDTLHLQDLEDFNYIDIWVNTACNRIGDEKPNIIEIDDLLKFEGAG
ncbi:diphthamide synthesis protein [Candidatus Woesearchaeota archaeon]|nr:diphthamide synthesis protein [Candidatus Woesearchaeota archaeon]